jgi:hypothetical protein
MTSFLLTSRLVALLLIVSATIESALRWFPGRAAYPKCTLLADDCVRGLKLASQIVQVCPQHMYLACKFVWGRTAVIRHTVWVTNPAHAGLCFDAWLSAATPS